MVENRIVLHKMSEQNVWESTLSELWKLTEVYASSVNASSRKKYRGIQRVCNMFIGLDIKPHYAVLMWSRRWQLAFCSAGFSTEERRGEQLLFSRTVTVPVGLPASSLEHQLKSLAGEWLRGDTCLGNERKPERSYSFTSCQLPRCTQSRKEG